MTRDVGRTFWWAKDAAWWRRERIVELGEEFGPAGPAVIDWLSCEAKLQNSGGHLRTGFRSLARGCFIDLESARHVVSRSVALGLLDEFEEADGGFFCRISGWRADQERGRAASRKADQRSRDGAAIDGTEPNKGRGPGVTVRDSSRPVTPGHVESLNRTEQKRRKGSPPPPQAGEPPTPPSGRRQRDLDRYAAELRVWAPHPEPADLGVLADVWTEIAAVVESSVTESTWASWLSGLHVHSTHGDQLILGCHSELLGTVRSNYQKLLERAAGAPVVLVPCETSIQEPVAA